MASLNLATNSNRKDYLYSVLNLPTCASQNEIRERYRSLSVIFHPDKQQNEQTKETASHNFLEIQRAYSVLSDPFLREVYDILGEEGLKKQWPTGIRSRSVEEIRAALSQSKIDRTSQKFDELINPRGAVTTGINATSLFSDDSSSEDDGPSSPLKSVIKRFQGISLLSLGVRHSVKKEINPKTTVGLSGYISRTGSKAGKGSILGTVQYAFSSRLLLEASVSFLHPCMIIAKTTYSDENSTYGFQTNFIPSVWFIFPPVSTFSFSRKLFRGSRTEGSLSWTISPQSPGQVDIMIYSPEPFNFAAPDDYVSPMERMISDLNNKPGSWSGFGVGSVFWTYGLTVAGIQSGLKTEWGVRFTELALQLKAGLMLNLRGISCVLTSSWSNKENGVSTSIVVGSSGVVMNIEFKYLFQKWAIPVVLAAEYNPAAAFCTTVLPSAALALGYHLILKPRRRAQRARYFQAARTTLKEEKSDLRREIEESALLLRDTAAKYVQLERSRGGLVVEEATYGPTCPDEDAKDLNLDVTIPVQALVHNSQLYVPGHRTKSGIQGFYDPAPASPKSLRVRYLFRGRMHYAEIPDFVPIVLPLRDHLVD